MSAGLNASQARAKAHEDLVIYDEIQTIMTEIITQSALGNYAATVSDGTTMTESTPTAVVTGTVANPTITPGQTLIVEGYTVTLGTTASNLNGIIADINDAAVTDVVASKDSSNKLVLTFTAQASTTWTYEIGAGTANTQLGLTANTYTYTNPLSVTYHAAWMGTVTDRAKVVQMDTVIKHFQTLGYRIERSVNTSTQSTFQWNLYW